MKIAIASDHAGFNFKKDLLTILKEDGHEVDDFGCDSMKSCDYPDFGIPAAKSVSEGKNDRAILICGNGIGMTMLANKIQGILAALVYSESTATATREHHNSNVLCLGARELKPNILNKLVNIWLNTSYEGGRHNARIKKIKELEKNNEKRRA